MYSRDPWNIDTALVGARALLQLRDGNSFNSVFAEMVSLFGPAVDAGSTEPDRGKLRARRADFAERTVILFYGCQSVRQGLDVNEGWFSPPNENPGLGENAALANVALATTASLFSTPIPPGTVVEIFGYSLGAGAGVFIGTSLSELFPWTRPMVVQYNPVRPAIREYAANASPIATFRWHSDNDAMASLPLHSSELTIGPLPVFAYRQARANRYEQIGVGVQVASGGTVLSLAAGEVPAGPSLPQTSLVSAWAGLDDDGGRSHYMAELLRRLVLFRSLVAPGREMSVLGNTPFALSNGSLPPSNVVPAVIAQAHTLDEVRNDRHSRQAAGFDDWNTSTTPNILKSDPRYKPFWACRNSGSWFVMYGNQPLFQDASKRLAKKKAAQLNELTRNISDLTQKDIDGLVQAVGAEAS
jgi:hypothetical protein